MVESHTKKLKVAIIGATGAIGKEIIRCAKQEDRISELALIVRTPLEEWDQEHFKPKLNIIRMESFDDMSSLKHQLEGYDAFICTLGTRTKYGTEIFTKVDYTYPLEFGKLGKELGIKYYGLLTSTGGKTNSIFLYMRIKGEVERDVKELNLPCLAVMKPGFLENRLRDFNYVFSVQAYA